MSCEPRRERVLLVEDFPGAARQIVQSIGREYEIMHLAAFDVARTLIEHLPVDHYIFDIDFPNTHAEWLQFIDESIESRIEPSYIAGKYYHYGNGLRLFEVMRRACGDEVPVLLHYFQRSLSWPTRSQPSSGIAPL